MTIFGVALLAACTLVGVYLGDLLGIALGVKANVGGVGLAMILLIAVRLWLARSGKLSPGSNSEWSSDPRCTSRSSWRWRRSRTW